jgi:hypothetical protein
VNGLHFEVGNPVSLAETITTAVTATGLWDDLRAGIPPVFSMSDHVANLIAIYHELLTAPSDSAVAC